MPDIFIGEFDIDFTAPQVTSNFPTGIDVPILTEIAFNITDTGGCGVDTSSINVKVNGVYGIQNSIYQTGWHGGPFTSIPNGYHVVLQKDTPLLNLVSYLIQIDAQDLAPIPNIMPSYSWEFTTEIGGGELISYEVDTVLTVYQSIFEHLLGHRSKFHNPVHPGTNKHIEGWKWGKGTWSSKNEFKALSYAPNIFDASEDRIEKINFQSGYGYGNDLLLLDINSFYTKDFNLLIPKVCPGFFYTHNSEWYLYSDWYQTNYFTLDNVVSGQQYVDLDYLYKGTYPIKVRRFEYNKLEGEHITSLNFSHVLEFTDSGNNEFMLDLSNELPRVIIDGIYNEEIGLDITISGVEASNLDTLELVGISTGEPDQQFYLKYSPIDSSQEINIYVWNSNTIFEKYTVISGVDQFSEDTNQVRIDIDKGLIQFGNYNRGTEEGDGHIPAKGKKISVQYTAGLDVTYEPFFAKDYLLSHLTNLDPVQAGSTYGFVQLGTKLLNVSNILLTGIEQYNLVEIVPDNTYQIEVGSNIGLFRATVYDQEGEIVEGAQVNFEIISPIVGALGGYSNSLSALSDSNGQASIIYNAPQLIDEIAAFTNEIYFTTNGTYFDVPLTYPSSISGVYLYKVHEYDETLGIPSGLEDTYYSDYLTEWDIVSGETAGIDWEQLHRDTYTLGRPITYESGDITTGKRTILLTSGVSTAINPHTGEYDINTLVPIFPSSVQSIGTVDSPMLRVYYSYILDDIGENDTKSYFLVSDTKTRLRASVINPRTNTRVYSNIIELKVVIPAIANGTYLVDALNYNTLSGLLTAVRNVWEIDDSSINETSGLEDNYSNYLEERLLISGVYEDYKDWFRRTRRADTSGFIEAGETIAGFDPGLIIKEIQDYPGIIPLGLRLKSTGITVASLLDSITYLDPNDHLPSGYFEVSGILVSGYWT